MSNAGIGNGTHTLPSPLPSGPGDVGEAEYDALADLFLDGGVGALPATTLRLAGSGPCVGGAGLGADEQAAATRKSASGSDPSRKVPRVEGLILGHLPVLGAAWVMQYCRALAERDGAPIGLVRIQGGQLWVDVVPPRSGEGAKNVQGCGGETFLETFKGLAGEVEHWVVRVDETAEVDLARSGGLCGLTMLTGTDDPALIASFRTIKSLGIAEGKDDVTLSVAVMGADAGAAKVAQSKLSETARVMLGRQIHMGVCVGKVGPCGSVAMYRGDFSGSVPEVLKALSSAYVGRPSSDRPGAASTARQLDASASMVREAPQVAGPQDTVGKGRAAKSVSGGPSGIAAHYALILEHLSLTLLDAACPYAPEVRLAAGKEGQLHLVAEAASEGALMGAAAWADAHAGLLRAAHPGMLKGGVDSVPTLHVVTKDARAARSLLDTGLRVHLAVEVGGAWALRELN